MVKNITEGQGMGTTEVVRIKPRATLEVEIVDDLIQCFLCVVFWLFRAIPIVLQNFGGIVVIITIKEAVFDYVGESLFIDTEPEDKTKPSKESSFIFACANDDIRSIRVSPVTECCSGIGVEKGLAPLAGYKGEFLFSCSMPKNFPVGSKAG